MRIRNSSTPIGVALIGTAIAVALIGTAIVATAARVPQASAQSYEALTIAASAVGFAAATIRPSTSQPAVAMCQGRLETAQVRYRYDGTDPTASEGILLEVGDFFTLKGTTNIQQIRFIRTGSTSGVLRVQCGQE